MLQTYACIQHIVIHSGLTANVVKPSVLLAVWSAPTVRFVGELPAKSIQVHLLTLSLPRLRGTISAATTVNFVVVKATRFGVPRLRVNVRSVNLLLGRGKPPVSSDISVDDFSQFLHDKVDAVRQNTAGAPEPTFSSVRSGTSGVLHSG